MTRAGRLGRYAASVCIVATLYYAAAKLGLRLAYLNGAVTALWPPVGVGMAALVLYGPRLWPGVTIADLQTREADLEELFLRLTGGAGGRAESAAG